MPLPHGIVVSSWAGVIFHAPRAQLRLRPLVGDQRNLAARERHSSITPRWAMSRNRSIAATSLRAVFKRSERLATSRISALLSRRRREHLLAEPGAPCRTRRRVGMHRHRRVAEHRLGPRRGDRDKLRLARAGDPSHRVAEVPEVSLHGSWNTSSSLTAVCRNVSQFTSRLPR